MQGFAVAEKRPRAVAPGLLNGTNESGGGFENMKTAVPFEFPNVAHSYWDHFVLTGDYYLKPSKLSSKFSPPICTEGA